LTTSPTATSSLFFGLATYCFFGCLCLGRGGDDVGRFGNGCRGARAQVDVDVVDDLEGVFADRDRDEISEKVGELLLIERPDIARGREVTRSFVELFKDTGTSLFELKLAVRCRDAKVELYSLAFVTTNGPDTDRLDEDDLLGDRCGGCVVSGAAAARLDVGRAGGRSFPSLDAPTDNVE
jgi:hypothetical protein